jgi:hypothetical protein
MTNAEATAETAAVAEQVAQGAPEAGGGPHSQPGARRRNTGLPGAKGWPISGMSQDESFTCGRAARGRPALSALWRPGRAVRPGPRTTPLPSA